MKKKLLYAIERVQPRRQRRRGEKHFTIHAKKSKRAREREREKTK